ncbi:MAG TPA: TolC family protein, partial [Xanthobacteraceae bacterium]|nr:TolC family protein [Xanthobacteraceae bacterium]
MASCRPVIVVAAVWLAGCTVGPDYATPGVPVPGSFEASPTMADGGSDAAPAANVTRWWRTLHDRELDSLVDRAVAGNHDIAEALMRVQQARAQEVVVLGAALPQVGISAAEAVSSGNNPTKGRVAQTLNAGVNTAGYSAVTGVAGFDAGWELDL